MCEFFIPICNYENLYSVSNMGNIRNDRTGRILKNSISNNGYYVCKLYKDHIGTSHLVHRIILSNFLPMLIQKPCIDHINNIKTDNRVVNLRWCTYQENNMNKGLDKRNTSKVRGVYFNKPTGKWMAYITINKVMCYLGLFTDIKLAKLARINEAVKRFGKFINDCELKI